METALCLHCSQPVAGFGNPDFCCHGCEAVYQFLRAGPLSDFYEIKKSGICFNPGAPVTGSGLDHSDWNSSTANPAAVFIEGIHCSACVWLLERLPIAIPEDVESASLNLSRSLLTLRFRAGADRARVAKTIEAFGYLPHLLKEESAAGDCLERENRKRLIELGVAGAISGNVMLLSIPLYSGVGGAYQGLFESASFLVSIPAVFYCGRSFFRNTLSGIRNRVFPIDGPILLAILTAFFYSVWSWATGGHELYFDSLTALIFLLLASRYLLARIRQSSNLNPEVLSLFHQPFKGAIGDEVHPTCGEVLSFDGRVERGRAWMDQSSFTGESQPVAVMPGEKVHAGTRVVSAEADFKVRVMEVGQETRLARFLRRLEESRGKRTQVEQANGRWARTLLKLVLAVAMGASIWFHHFGYGIEGMRRVLALLIVTCPCALALATPLVYSLASVRLLKDGVLVKDPEALDQVLNVRNLYFDKTGTLTFGVLKMDPEDLRSLNENERSILLGLTGVSQHPVSRGVFRELREQFPRLQGASIESWKEVSGVGIEGFNSGVRYGLRKNPDSAKFGVQFYRSSPNGEVEISEIRFQDVLRPDTAKVLEDLRARGMSLTLLTGDHLENAKKVLGDLDLEVRAGLSPEEKAESVANGMMVGDGVNDALALSEARVGFAVQGGLEAAIDSAGLYSLKPGISGVATILDAGARVRSVLRMNFALSTAFNLFAGTLAITGWMSPLLAAVLMPASAVTVFLNSLIRMREKPV